MESTVWTLPFPSSWSSGAEFRKLLRRQCALVFSDEDGSDVATLTLLFDDVEAFKCTYHHACTLEMREAYDKVVDVGPSEWLTAVKNQLAKYDEDTVALRHLMIYFDDGPCYEFICREFRAEKMESSGKA